MTEESQDIPAVDGSSPRRTEFSAPPPMVIDVEKTYTAEMATSMGAMTIHLNPALAPKTVNNFVFLARWHYYDGIIFHRVIDGFVVQGGDPQGTGMGGPGYRFEDELPAPGRYELGSLAMANAGPNTNGSQFFIITGPSGQGLPPQYSLFGQVISGLEVADAMQKVPTNHSDRPETDIVIESVVITENEEV
ncbi:MAG: Peptidyl-prolyl cis-trans isomerase B [Acidimicrobiales bacterium AG-410-I20]|nr:MAG: Peptidyl-prolyl cis-trans isomerase B [Acidimicrobiales bacterium AG-410-I20]